MTRRAPRPSPPDDDVLTLATVELEDPEREPPNPSADDGDRADGESWMEDIMEVSAMDLPADRPLSIEVDGHPARPARKG